ncbi:MAG: sigma-54-dependent Fis family transcriptional regulator [Spirochaetaceae bacterium]|nr:MAG: sigma-54-dependent Fis family transcriptional regulator [Spirochaetaceae bacterium]
MTREMEPKIHSERILVVDDAPDTLEILKRNLSSQGFSVFNAPGVAEAINILETTSIDLVITDLKMPRTSGLDLVHHVRDNFKDTEIMVITGYPTLEGAVEAVKTGAEEYLAKPFTEEELFQAVNKVLEKLSVQRAGRAPGKKDGPAFEGIIGQSPAIKKVFQAIEKAASTSATVLISGESGSGKELVARAIHYISDRASAPFVAVNCSAIPENLLESELFGYVRGAFTGAEQSRAGFFQTADQGTIFLDEVSETGPSMQVKLLRVLQEKEIFMLGSSRPIRVDVRIIASTNKDLSSAVRQGSFREDLFYRLHVVTIALPSLRDRGNDILILANHFSAKFAKELGKPIPKFTDRALLAFKRYDWPGNVRELENVVQRSVIMTDTDKIDVPDLPSGMRFSAQREIGLKRTLAEVEAEHILNVLASVEGNRTRAAEILAIDRKTLREKLKKIQ